MDESGKKGPTPEQIAAIECNDLDILVEAGAGSGKTSTTIDRYARLVTDGGPDDESLDPSAVLVFTFTDKAATELRNRVREVRARMEADGSGESFSMSSAWVGTFHSICSRILRSHPIQADVDPAFAVLDDVQATRLKEAAYDRALEAYMKEGEQEELIARFTASHLRTGISSAYEQLRSRGEIEPKLPAPEPLDVGRTLMALRAHCDDAIEVPGITKDTKAKIQAMVDYIGGHTAETITFPGFDEAKLVSGSTKLGPLPATVKEMRGVLAAAHFGDELRVGLSAFFSAYSEKYAQIKRDAGVLDYEDLQLLTLRLLRSHKTIARRYREQFREIMVDEFQDTNQLQLNLISELRGEQTRLFTVGDEMQAIYGFRHADVSLFRSRRKDPKVTVLPLTANFRSQSSVIGAVNLIGKELDKAATDSVEPEHAAGRHLFTGLKVGLETDPVEGDEVELLFTEPEGWREHDLGPLAPAIDPENDLGSATDGQYQAEALLLAQHLADLVRTGKAEPGEIAILFRAKSRIWIFVEALKQVGLKPYVVGGSGFWESREGVDLKSLLAVVANPLDDDALLGALAGPACGLSTDALTLLSRAGGYGDPLWYSLEIAAAGGPGPGIAEKDAERAGVFVRTVNSIRERSGLIPLGEVVEAVVTGTGYDLANLVRDPSGSGLANIRRVATLASEYEAAESRDLRGFLDWIEISARLDAEAAVATEEENGDAVQLMTVHKSKGLQFGVVCVADLGRKRKSPGESVFWLGEDPDPSAGGKMLFGLRVPMPDGAGLDLYDWTRLAEAAARDNRDEELRLFHVALTRAERRLLISGTCDLDPGKEPSDSASTAKRISAALGIDRDNPESIAVKAAGIGVDGLANEPVESRIAIRRNDANEDQAEYLRRSEESAATNLLPRPGRPPINLGSNAAQPEVPLSFTALSEFQECPTRFYASRVLRLERPEGPELPLDPESQSPNVRKESTAFGSAIHELLEICAENGWIKPTDTLIEMKLAEQGATLNDPANVARAGGMISGFLGSSLGERIRAERTDAEIPLLVRVGDVTVRGFADLVARKSNPPLILDYKSNNLTGTTAAEKMKGYALQRDLYALAVADAMRTEAVDTAFVFLEAPDEPVVSEYGRDELAEAREVLETLVGAITAGKYFEASDAVPDGPCRQCWACERLSRQIDAAAERSAAAILA